MDDVLLWAAGGVLNDRLFAEQCPSTLRQVLAPKLQGVQNLIRLAEKVPPSAFVAFSSIAALLGNAGQANYAAANAAMEALGEAKTRSVSRQSQAMPQCRQSGFLACCLEYLRKQPSCRSPKALAEGRLLLTPLTNVL